MGDDATAARARDDAALLVVDRVAIGYRRQGRYLPAVGEASFQVRRGEKVMLLGPSGCGKSTILKAVAGFLRPSAGRIVVDGREARSRAPTAPWCSRSSTSCSPGAPSSATSPTRCG
ncbi:ATP-binding cassette domain-containing protein [Actinomadura keratinilytica]|uniref:ATP-binding cassette domain-containing protein n=1 Tax=Actinomadura keratinilytica TaxID=547461 RepID=UPI003608439C